VENSKVHFDHHNDVPGVAKIKSEEKTSEPEKKLGQVSEHLYTT
jgi:hypothetical protein